MFRTRLFRVWFVVALLMWLVLFSQFSSIGFLIEHWYYPAIMVLGAFVAGSTPEGGGAVAFPILNIFLQIDRAMARDFSLMIQSIGMTSASIFILANSDNRSVFKPLMWMIPLCFGGFVLGMGYFQTLPVYVIQALFLSLITAFALVYSLARHRGCQTQMRPPKSAEWPLFGLVLISGGICASLFGTGADIILYTLLVTLFRMQEKIATQMAIMLMAAMSILGFAYRGLIDDGLTHYQIQTWLSAYPVVLFMAPFGALVLCKVNKELMLRGVAILNIAQLSYFLLYKGSSDKWFWASIFMALLTALFSLSLWRLGKRPSAALQ
ncbi:TSUP family transporter [Shewanella sp. JM162201]|uniref:Probable membrane transporter protein n=1 Tax=Shewanella jiangmenensis TaxID=2837387 RepID=A0ABS5V2Q6_9GAMM|nr:sulfite exporter TauE/SafE family protein [Shewanella jiangmenensis]MBT1444732.1 TSUP family transporter [Shewanella jiangmenensis]